MTQRQTTDDIFGEVIYSYTRAQAIEDGVLADASKMAREAGFRIPVAISTGVLGYVTPTEAQKKNGRATTADCGTCLTCYSMG